MGFPTLKKKSHTRKSPSVTLTIKASRFFRPRKCPNQSHFPYTSGQKSIQKYVTVKVYVVSWHPAIHNFCFIFLVKLAIESVRNRSVVFQAVSAIEIQI